MTMSRRPPRCCRNWPVRRCACSSCAGTSTAGITYGPPHVGEVRVAADASGHIVAYEYHGWQHNWSQVETTTQLAGVAPAAEWPPVAVQGVNPLICGGMYDIANLKLVNHRLPALDWLRAAWLRSPLDLAFAFVSEQAIDQLAVDLSIDPVEFRRRNIRDARWRGVLDAAATAAGWSPDWNTGVPDLGSAAGTCAVAAVSAWARTWFPTVPRWRMSKWT